MELHCTLDFLVAPSEWGFKLSYTIVLVRIQTPDGQVYLQILDESWGDGIFVDLLDQDISDICSKSCGDKG